MAVTDSGVICRDCKVKMRSFGTIKFRTGGTSGALGALFGELAELGEDTVPFIVYACPKCGKVELFSSNALELPDWDELEHGKVVSARGEKSRKTQTK